MKYLIKLIIASNIKQQGKFGLLFFLISNLFFTNVFSQNRQDAFIQNEVYVKIKESIDIERSKSQSDVDESKFDFLTRNNRSEFSIESVKASFYFSRSEEFRRIFRLKFGKTEKVEDLIKVLKQSEQIEAVERIPMLRTTTTPDPPNDLGADDEYSSDSQYSLYLVNAMEAWGVTQGDPNIVVAVVDEAIQIDHIDLADNIVDGRDVADDDDDPNPPNDPDDPSLLDNDFDHGTHVAGIVGAVTHNSTGIASIGNRISIMPVKARKNIPDPEGCNDCISHGWEGVLWAAENGADVINCSFGLSGPLNPEGLPSPFWQGIIDQAYDLGAIIVASAGNHNYTCKNYPAAYNRVFSVANTDKDDKLYQNAGFTSTDSTPCAVTENDCSAEGTCAGVTYTTGSTHGTWVDICAPGRRIKSTLPNDDYGLKTGTSMAAPLVAGLCGLILSVNPSLTQDQVLNCITSTAVDIDALNPGFEGLLGAGRIDAHAAVLCASDPPDPEVYTFEVVDCCIEFSPTNYCTSNDYSFGWNYNPIPTSASYEMRSKYSIQLMPGFYMNALAPLPGEKGNNPFLAHIGVCSSGTAKINSPIVQIGSNIKNYPNPFANTTEIVYTVDTEESVSLFVSDITGRRLSTLINSEKRSIGNHQMTFDGAKLKSGIYYCTLQIGNRLVTQKMVVTK